MIKEKLEEARLRNAKRRMWIAGTLFATISLCVLLVIGLSSFQFPGDKKPELATTTKQILSNSDREKVREDFKNLLQQYENDLEPRLQRANVELWNRDGFFEIKVLKEQAMSNFSNGDYLKAQANLQLLNANARQILDEAKLLFKENLSTAKSFLSEDLYDEAKLHIEKALMVAPQAEEALFLQQEIEKLPNLLPLLSEIKISRAENDLQKEYDFLEQVLHLSPEREGVTGRSKELAELINDKKFASHISSGYAGIQKRKAKEARIHYLQAKKIDSERSELSLLLRQILELETSLRFQSSVKQAEQAVRKDDWQNAWDYFTRAAKDAPGNAMVVEGLKRADLVLGILASFSHYFNNPYRLGNTHVRREAEQILEQAGDASKYSFTVKKQAEQLGELIVKINRLIPVTIISDNKTNVIVRTVGKVGVVLEKIIQLKPGNYTFEGARDGFKSKLVQAFIPYDRANFSVRIVCDEPI